MKERDEVKGRGLVSDHSFVFKAREGGCESEGWRGRERKIERHTGRSGNNG